MKWIRLWEEWGSEELILNADASDMFLMVGVGPCTQMTKWRYFSQNVKNGDTSTKPYFNVVVPSE